MNHIRVLFTFAFVAGCGGKAATSTIGNQGENPAGLADGIHGCHFVQDDYVYNHHRCDIRGGELHKLSGMELLKGTVRRMGDTLAVAATMDCGEEECPSFSAELRKEGEVWTGVIQPTGGHWLFQPPSTFVLDDSTAYGGEFYGGGEGE